MLEAWSRKYCDSEDRNQTSACNIRSYVDIDKNLFLDAIMCIKTSWVLKLKTFIYEKSLKLKTLIHEKYILSLLPEIRWLIWQKHTYEPEHPTYSPFFFNYANVKQKTQPDASGFFRIFLCICFLKNK